MKRSLLTTLLIFNGGIISSTLGASHFDGNPYECLTSRVSKRSGKTYATLHYIHPKKGLIIKLPGIKKKATLKIANLYTTNGRYDGVYKGDYPAITKVKFGTYWPKKKVKIEEMISKMDKTNCKKMINTSFFDLPYLNTLSCMDPRKTGSCKALGR